MAKTKAATAVNALLVEVNKPAHTEASLMGALITAIDAVNIVVAPLRK
jgi:hypothetical protein